jgi:multiple sugar transport system ATP-binding protein
MTLADRIVAMHGGSIQQIGAPLELYDRPTNLFVAGFIGSPGMNFLSGAWDAAARAVRLADGARLPVAQSAALPDGSAVTVGIRPEHVSIAGKDSFPAVVELVEPTGHGIILHLRFQNESFKVLTTDRRHLQPAATVSLHLPADRLHLFDAEGRRID